MKVKQTASIATAIMNLKKKDGLYSRPLLQNLNLRSYFFLVFAGAFAVGFFAVPQGAPLPLHAITDLLHKR